MKKLSINGAARVSARLAPAALLAAGGLACGSPGQGQRFAETERDIIGGFHADAPELDHTGALVAIDPLSGDIFSFCSSTLIGPETVVTAKHCAVVLPDAELAGFRVAWAAGPDAQAPLELIPIAAVETAPGDVGGFVAMGRDVAALHLDQPTALTPAAPAAFSDDLIGTAMVSIGYGVYGATGSSDDQRRIGRETVLGTEGPALGLLLGSFENFVEWVFTGQTTPDDYLLNFPPDDPTIAALLQQFEALRLFDQHEAVTGLASTDTQSCFGDSGGPLARYSEDEGWLTYGVVSGGLSSLRLACDYGTVFSTFGPGSFAFLQQALDWVDPCGNVPPSGSCSGAIARNCDTNFIGNIRRLVQEDCGAQGLSCMSSPEGTGCGAIPPPEPIDPPEPGAEQVVLDAVRTGFLPDIGVGLAWQE